MFAATREGTDARPRVAYERGSAADLKVPESCFRDAIFDEPELVVGPCSEAGRTAPDDKWLPWHKGFDLDGGRIDVRWFPRTAVRPL